MTASPGLDELVRTRKVIVCVGGGGVGKTTMSAAIALRAAALGRSACVVTIDPAKRLATAMGLPALGNTETRVGDERFAAAGVAPPAGQLWAMMLDPKQTWDALVARFALDAEQVRRILANRYYQQISTALAGSQEFMAMEKLYELYESGKYDLLVLDTPPTEHALDFLDAPQKMMGFMDESVLRVFLAPSRLAGRMGLGFLAGPGAWMFKALERITGFEVLRDVSDFVGSFSGMHAGFRDRARMVETFLRAPGSAFVLVASPNPLAIEEATRFYRKLTATRMPFGGFILNRVHAHRLQERGERDAWEAVRQDPVRILRTLGVTADPSLAGRMAENFEHLEGLAERDEAQVSGMRTACAGPHFWCPVPAFDVDIYDLSGLVRVNERLFVQPG